MADEKPTDLKPDEKQTPSQTSPVDPEAIATATAKAVAAEMAKASAAAQAAREERPAPASASAPPPPLDDPDSYDDEINKAIADGDHGRSRDLLRKQRRAIEARTRAEFNGAMNQGAVVIGEIAKQAVASDPDYQRYAKEVDAKIAELQRNFPGTIITPTHWKNALQFVAGEHRDDIRREEREATIRRARESGAALTPEGTLLGRDQKEEEQPKLTDVLHQDFVKGAFRDKSREYGNRSLEEEVRTMNMKTLGGKWAKIMGVDVRKIKDHVAQYLNDRKEMEAVLEDKPTLGLDE